MRNTGKWRNWIGVLRKALIATMAAMGVASAPVRAMLPCQNATAQVNAFQMQAAAIYDQARNGGIHANCIGYVSYGGGAG